jgi:hypothetical protein
MSEQSAPDESGSGEQPPAGDQPQGGAAVAAGPSRAARVDAEALASDREYRQGAIDLLGVLAYGELTAFERLAEDARLAPTLADKVHMATLASAQIEHFGRVRDRVNDLGVDVMAAMQPFHAPFNSFHEYTKPKDWLEGLVKAYVGDGFANDFYREVAAFVDPETRSLVYEVLSDEGHADYVVQKVRRAIDADRKVAGRLALWGRRLVGEALSQAQRVAAERDALTSLLTGTVDRPGMDLAAISRMFSRLIETHTQRMAKLGRPA